MPRPLSVFAFRARFRAVPNRTATHGLLLLSALAFLSCQEEAQPRGAPSPSLETAFPSAARGARGSDGNVSEAVPSVSASSAATGGSKDAGAPPAPRGVPL